MPIGIIAGIAGAGLSYFGQKASANASKKQAKYQWQQNVTEALHSHQANMQAWQHNKEVAELQNKFQNEQILQSNKHTLQIFGARLDQFAEQVKFNEEAATRAFQGIQQNRNRALTQLAYERQDRAAALLQALGANDASMDPNNRSAQLAAQKATWGNYGRNAARLAAQDAEINYDAFGQVRDLQRQYAYQNYQAGIPTSVSPLLQNLVPMMPVPPPPQLNMPSRPSFSSGMSNALMIGNAAMAGLSAYQQFAKPTMKAPSGGGSKMGGYGVNSSNYSQSAFGGSGAGSSGFNMSDNLSNNFSGNLSNNRLLSGNQVGAVNFRNNMKLSLF